jgi:hypothetical protein
MDHVRRDRSIAGEASPLGQVDLHPVIKLDKILSFG